LLYAARASRSSSPSLTLRRRHVYKPDTKAGRDPAHLFLGAFRRFSRNENFMANTKSAQKAARQTLRRTEVNKSRRSEMRTFVRKVEEAIDSKDPKAAAEALREAEPRLARAAQKGIVHKNAASRKISRLTKRVKALSA
jgi:small subunit ribosomal protein S20